MQKMTVLMTIAFLMAAANAQGEELQPPTPAELCKGRATFAYDAEMMQIEGAELRSEITHTEANSRKLARHLLFVGELKTCESEKAK